MRATVAGYCLFALAACRPSTPTFARDVAPILFARCAPCHHDGGAAPFALVRYDDAARRATQIAKVTGRHFMPPWKARAADVRYANERRLGDDEIATLSRWADAAAICEAVRRPSMRFRDLDAALRIGRGHTRDE